VKESIAPYLDPVKGKDRIAAACEDYRAAAHQEKPNVYIPLYT